jgi:hypothetical protein
MFPPLFLKSRDLCPQLPVFVLGREGGVGLQSTILVALRRGIPVLVREDAQGAGCGRWRWGRLVAGQKGEWWVLAVRVERLRWRVVAWEVLGLQGLRLQPAALC